MHSHLSSLRGHLEGATNNELLVLSLLWHRGARGANELAAEVGLTSGGLSVLVDRLEERRLLRRAPHANDGRRTVVSLTHEGNALLTATAA